MAKIEFCTVWFYFPLKNHLLILPGNLLSCLLIHIYFFLISHSLLFYTNKILSIITKRQWKPELYCNLWFCTLSPSSRFEHDQPAPPCRVTSIQQWRPQVPWELSKCTFTCSLSSLHAHTWQHRFARRIKFLLTKIWVFRYPSPCEHLGAIRRRIQRKSLKWKS